MIAGLALVAGLAGCGSAGPADRTIRRDSAGIEIVTSTAGDRRLDWHFEKVLTLGGADGGVEAFYQVRAAGLAFDARGRIYILDSGNGRVLVFDRRGVPVRTIGRKGDGPGEFLYPARLAVDAAGTVFVHDPGHTALLRFDTSGSHVGQVPITGAVHSLVRVDGSVIVIARHWRDPASGERVFGLHRIARGDSTTILTMPFTAIRQVHYASCGLGAPQAPLFSDPLAWDARAGRIAFADAPHYSIRLFEDGVERRHVRRAIDPEPATAEHAMRELGDGQEMHVPRRGDCFVPTSEIIEVRGIADEVPVLADIAISPSGQLWAQRHVIGEDAGPIDVFDPTGEYIGTLPPGTPWPVDFGPGDSILVLEEDGLGVQFAVVYRVRKG